MDAEPAPATPQEVMSPAVPVLPAHVRFDATPYLPDGGFSAFGLLMLFLGLAAAGVVLGVITFYVSKLIYFIVVFPMLIGFTLGGIGAVLVKIGKIRSPLLVGGAGLLAGILAMTTVHFLEYRTFLEKRDEDLAKVPMLKNAGKDGRDLLINLAPVAAEEKALLRRELAVSNFFDYIDYAAHRGVSLKHGAGKDKGMNLGYIGTYIYWGIETLIVAGIVFSMVRKPAHEPFCTLTNEWKTARCGDNFTVPVEVGVDAAANALKNGELGQLAAYKAQGANSTGHTEPLRLYVLASPQHFEQCTLEARLVRFVAGKQGQMEEKEIAIATYPAGALPSFETFCS